LQGVISLELLTVFIAGPLAVYICYSLSKKDPKASIWMIILATAELYGGKAYINQPIKIINAKFVSSSQVS
jgi:hypothetical protein